MQEIKLVGCALVLASCSGAPQSRIVGGHEAILGQFPHQASIRDNDLHVCGGSVLDENTILTSAYCAWSLSLRNKEVTVVVGTNVLIGGGTHVNVSEVIIHPEFDISNIVNDIAIMKLSTKIVYNKFLQPIKIATEEPEVDERLTVSGWGWNVFNGSQPNELKYAQVDAVSWKECKAEHNDSYRITESNICTKTTMTTGNCFGDAGGALINGNKEQVGVVSWYLYGSGRPDVYTLTTHYVEWILSNL